MLPDKDMPHLQLPTTINTSSSAWSREGKICSNQLTCCSLLSSALCFHRAPGCSFYRMFLQSGYEAFFL